MSYKRKYKKGAKIHSLDELSRQEYVYLFDKIYHFGWFKSWQFRLVDDYIKHGFLYYAERNNENEE